MARRKKFRISNGAIFGTLALATLLACCAVFVSWGMYYAKTELAMARQLKQDVKKAASCMLAQDADSTDKALNRLQKHCSELRDSLDHPLVHLAEKVPYGAQQVQTVYSLLDILEEAENDLLRPAAVLLRDYPLSKEKGGLPGSETMVAWLDFAQTALPRGNDLISRAGELDLSLLDRDGKIAELMQTAEPALQFAGQYAPAFLEPAREQLSAVPLESIKVDDGFDTRAVISYLDFAEPLIPVFRRMTEELKNGAIGDLSGIPKAEKILKQAENLLELYDDNRDIIPFVRAFLGSGENRRYLMAALNSAEVRAVGGFPGAMGIVRIRNGVLSLGNFKSVYRFLPSAVPAKAGMTWQEASMFSCNLTSMNICWDACLNPDFERVAQIWSLGYESRIGYSLDGMIAVTPAVIQDLLQVAGEISLSDGTLLNGQNATRVLQHDLYTRYFRKGARFKEGNDISDAVFAETAAQTMHSILSDPGISKLKRYAQIARESFADRKMMVWMKDPAEEEIVRSLGWNGGLTEDPDTPTAGIYFNCTTASKLGWYAEIYTDVGEPTENSDGSRTYPMTVTFCNVISEKEAKENSKYLVGSDGGAMDSSFYLFAPAGGTVSDFRVNKDLRINIGEYHGLQVGYLCSARLAPNSPVVVTYLLTTAPGVSAPLQISRTPTLQEYH